MKLALLFIALLPLEASDIISTQLTLFSSSVSTSVSAVPYYGSQNCSATGFSKSVASPLSCTSGFENLGSGESGSALYASAAFNNEGLLLNTFVAGIPELSAQANASASATWDYSVTITGGTGGGTAIFCPSQSYMSSGVVTSLEIQDVFGSPSELNICSSNPAHMSGGQTEQAYDFTYGIPFPLAITLTAYASASGQDQPDTDGVYAEPAWTIYTVDTSTVPEPTSLVLVALGGLTLLAINYLRISAISGSGNR